MLHGLRWKPGQQQMVAGCPNTLQKKVLLERAGLFSFRHSLPLVLAAALSPSLLILFTLAALSLHSTLSSSSFKLVQVHLSSYSTSPLPAVELYADTRRVL